MKKNLKKNITNDDLAIMVANGFDAVHKEISEKIGEVRDRLDIMEDKIGAVDENLKAARGNVLEIGDRFVSRFEFDNLLIRFGRLEQKVLGEKSK